MPSRPPDVLPITEIVNFFHDPTPAGSGACDHPAGRFAERKLGCDTDRVGNFCPEKPRIDPPPPPKPSVRLNGSLTIPDGRNLLAAPTINLDELWDRPARDGEKRSEAASEPDVVAMPSRFADRPKTSTPPGAARLETEDSFNQFPNMSSLSRHDGDVTPKRNPRDDRRVTDPTRAESDSADRSLFSPENRNRLRRPLSVSIDPPAGTATERRSTTRIPPLPDWSGLTPRKADKAETEAPPSIRLPDLSSDTTFAPKDDAAGQQRDTPAQLPDPAESVRIATENLAGTEPLAETGRPDAAKSLIEADCLAETEHHATGAAFDTVPDVLDEIPEADRQPAELDTDAAASAEPETAEVPGRLTRSDDRFPEPAVALAFRPECREYLENLECPESSRETLLVAQDLTKSYYKGKLKIPVLKGVDFSVRSGEFVSIVGQSGSGKSTLLHLLGTLDNPESGSIRFDGRRIDNISIAKRDVLRNREIGFIFQFYHLLPELTTLENVLSPLMIREGVVGYAIRRRRHIEKARAILEEVGLSHRLKHRPRELSGGEMQRAAIARALVTTPKMLLADEPTGNLDAASAREIIEILRRLNEEHRLTVIMVTHDHLIADAADRIVRMVDGVIVENDAAIVDNPFVRRA